MSMEIRIARDIADTQGVIQVRSGVFRIRLDSVQVMPAVNAVHILLSRINKATFSTTLHAVIISAEDYATWMNAVPAGKSLSEAIKGAAWQYVVSTSLRLLAYGKEPNWEGAEKLPLPEYLIV